MLVGDLRSFDKPPNVLEAEKLGRTAADANKIGRVRFSRTEEMSANPAGAWLDRVASLGLTMVLAVVLFLAVAALAQAGNPAAPRMADFASPAGSTIGN